MTRVLSLSTYPIRKPMHGGQRRVIALLDMLVGAGAEVRYAAVYEPPYSSADVGPDDLALGHSVPALSGVPFVGDFASGEFAANAPAAYRHFSSLFDSFKPDVVMLEHPFMWPLVRRWREDGRLGQPRLIYSSHNWEGPLKEKILLGAGVDASLSAAIAGQIEQMEKEICESADLVLAVSEEDAAMYRAVASGPVVVAPNGVGRPPPSFAATGAARVFGSRPFLFYVGSAYPPNIQGFLNLVTPDGAYYVPPVMTFAVCGGVCDGIFRSPVYHRYVSGNSSRVQFFPNTSDSDLLTLKNACHAILLPIQEGGGTNLKTAEALASGKWVVTTSTALRGFEAYREASGVVVADTPADFRAAITDVLKRSALQLSDDERTRRDELYWDRALAAGGAEEAVRWLLLECSTNAAWRAEKRLAWGGTPEGPTRSE